MSKKDKKAQQQADIIAQQRAREMSEVEDIFQKGITTLRDLVAPASLEFKSNYFIMGTRYCRTMYAYGYPRSIYTGWLSSIINLDEILDISMFIYPVDSQVVMGGLPGRWGAAWQATNWVGKILPFWSILHYLG